MVEKFKFLIVSVLLAFVLGGGVHAGEPLDAQADARAEQGVALYDDGQYEQAKAILLPLAEAGHPKAMHYIGRMFKFAQGFTQNYELGCDWYERAANAGYAKSMYNMSICYDGIGRPDDPEMDMQWLLKAADNGVTAAMINLAGMDDEQGKDYRRWMNMASDHGSRYAKVSLWMNGYEDDVPDVTIQDIVCVNVRVLLIDEHFDVCD